MIVRWIVTGVIGLLLVLDIALPSTSIGRRGSEQRVRTDVASVAQWVGQPLPRFQLESLSGAEVRSEDLLGHRLLITFERSVDW